MPTIVLLLLVIALVVWWLLKSNNSATSNAPSRRGIATVHNGQLIKALIVELDGFEIPSLDDFGHSSEHFVFESYSREAYGNMNHAWYIVSITPGNDGQMLADFSATNEVDALLERSQPTPSEWQVLVRRISPDGAVLTWHKFLEDATRNRTLELRFSILEIFKDQYIGHANFVLSNFYLNSAS
jgi:hypothetical protein